LNKLAAHMDFVFAYFSVCWINW